jgi:hypothetical protein
MQRHPNIDKILRDWPYHPHAVSVRLVKGDDRRELIQMRIEMGLLQLEVKGRPDGLRPEGYESYFEALQQEAAKTFGMVLSEDQCGEADREFVQFYHRRVCWLALREFEKAIADADHTLALMDFCREHSPDKAWTMTHEQYRPFVVFHRTQAATLWALEEQDAESAIEAVNRGIRGIEQLIEDVEDDELISRLVELRESVREKFSVGRTLQEQLGDAIASEQYELAARLRDQLADRHNR